MRCLHCGWIVGEESCPCGDTSPNQAPAPVANRTRVVSRLGRGPSMSFLWMPGEVITHQGLLHLVRVNGGNFWVELDDLLPDASEREKHLCRGLRVWALWVDGRWYGGRIDAVQGALRHVTWDDGDSMWLETTHLVPEVVGGSKPQVDSMVLAPRWDGQMQPARIEEQNQTQFRVVFSDGEEAWIEEDDLATVPPNPFLE